MTLTAFLLGIPRTARADALAESTPDDSLEPGKCYDPAQLKVIAGGLQELDVCRKTLALREQLIAEASLAPPPERAWWQEPTIVVGGVVVGFSVGAFVGWLVATGR